MHSGDDHRASNPGIPSGGHGQIGDHPRADQSGARAQHERFAKEQELIRPDDIRLDDRCRVKAKHHRPRGRPAFECIALVLPSGGPRGSYRAGVCAALTEAGL
jgi:hypothetical protein